MTKFALFSTKAWTTDGRTDPPYEDLNAWKFNAHFRMFCRFRPWISLHLYPVAAIHQRTRVPSWRLRPEDVGRWVAMPWPMRHSETREFHRENVFQPRLESWKVSKWRKKEGEGMKRTEPLFLLIGIEQKDYPDSDIFPIRSGLFKAEFIWTVEVWEKSTMTQLQVPYRWNYYTRLETSLGLL